MLPIVGGQIYGVKFGFGIVIFCIFFIFMPFIIRHFIVPFVLQYMTDDLLSSFSEGQKKFLADAQYRGIDLGLFGSFVPEIRFQEENPDPAKPTIAYLHTGGTLMMVPSRMNPVALSFESAIDIPKVIEVCDLIASIKSRYNVIGIFLANEDSKEVKPELWTSISATIKTLYDGIDGVVVGHGTHTLEYSAAAVAFALRNLAIPVVFTASQIPIIGYPGSDGLLNLTGSMEIAAYGDVAEVIVYTNGELLRGTRATKKNDQRLDVFEARVTGPLGYFTAGGIELRPGARRRSGKRKHELVFAPKFSKHVTTLKLQPGISQDLFQDIHRERDVGIILETYGSGAIPRSLVPILKKHLDRGFPILLSSSCAESGVSPLMDLHDEDAISAYASGIRNVRDMSTGAAVVKLMNIMGNMSGLSLDDIRHEMIDKNYAGEISAAKTSEDY